MVGKITGAITSAIFLAFFLWLGLWRLNIPFTLSAFGPFFYYGLFSFLVPALILVCGWAYDREEGFGWMLAPVGAFVLALVIGALCSSHMFNADRYAAQLSVPEATKFVESDIPAFEPSKIPWVDEEYAKVLGDKPIGSLGAIGSSVIIGEYIRQEVGGELFFVAPILHSDYWKYRKNPAGTPGFVMVSMNNDDDVRLVTKDLTGKELKIKVQPSGHAAWGDKLQRIVQRAVPGALRYEYKFEVDENLRPYWVVPIYDCTIGWGGVEITKVVLVDATNGQAKVYEIGKVPGWVDRIFPTDLIETQLANWGNYSNGFWNSLFSKTGCLQSDPGNAVVYKDNDCLVFDSLTSVGADESTVGFVLVNLRTKETKHFSLAGATEWAAQQSAIGDERVKAQGYAATFPLPTLIEGQATYFMVLTDPDSHIAKSFALVNVEKYQTLGIGNTIRAAEMDYRTKMRSNNNTSLYSPTANLLNITGKIVRWGQYDQQGNTYYSFVVSGHEDKIFNTDTSMTEAPLTSVGDRVALKVIGTDNSNWSVFSFDNLEFDQAKGEVEETVTEDEMNQKIQEVIADPSLMNEERFKEFWDLLTPEQQEAFLSSTTKK